MNDFWILLVIIWLPVEGLQYFRKVPFPRRMTAPLVCVALAAGLSSSGYAPQGANYSVHFLLGALVGAALGAMFYGFRLLMAKLWKEDVITCEIIISKNPLSKYKSLLKKIFLSLGIMAAIVGFVHWGFERYSDYKFQQEIAAKKALDDAVEVMALHPAEGVCPPNYPYVYYVKNNSGKIVERVSFNVHIKKVGFSGVLNYIPDGYPEFMPDKILQPGEVWGQCFSAKVSGYPYVSGKISEKNVEIKIVEKTVYFKN